MVEIVAWLFALAVLVLAVALWQRQRELRIRMEHELALRRLELERPRGDLPPLYETAPAVVMTPSEAPSLAKLQASVAEALKVDAPKQCSSCKHFNLEAGAQIMAANPAFHAATRAIPPWRMGRVLKQRPNPKREELVEARQGVLDAIAAQGGVSDDEQAQALRGLDLELHDTPDTIAAPDEEQVGPELLHATWNDMGACAKHEELRMRFDACPNYAPRS